MSRTKGASSRGCRQRPSVASFVGTVVSNAAIVLGTGSALNGRALTTAAGAVTLSGSNQIGSPCTTGLPTLPQVFIWILALTLIALGYRQLRHRQRLTQA